MNHQNLKPALQLRLLAKSTCNTTYTHEAIEESRASCMQTCMLHPATSHAAPKQQRYPVKAQTGISDDHRLPHVSTPAVLGMEHCAA